MTRALLPVGSSCPFCDEGAAKCSHYLGTDGQRSGVVLVVFARPADRSQENKTATA